jgi:tetratricopeptide (TPR) repeat protein
MRSVSPDSDPALRQELVDRLSHDVELTEIVRQTLLENPPAAVRILCAAGTPECLRLVREFALGTAGSVQDRLIALSAMREAGEIAEDEPVELQVDGDIRVVTPGRHRIVPDSPIELPDQETAALFFEGARLLDPSPEDAYERWKQVDARFSSARIKTHLARLSQNLGRLSESREWLEKALEIEPDLVEAHVAMATTYLMEGNLRPALDHARIVEEAAVVTVSEFMGYQAVRDNINGIMSSPMADALLAQADMASDEETADANRDLANLLGSMQKSLALTQYLRQRPILALREDLALHEIVDHLDPTVLYNAAWLFGMVDEMEALSPDDEDDDPDGERDSALSEQRIHQARERIANALLDPQRLMEGLPGLGDRDIRGLAWMLDRGGITPLDDYLKEFPPDEAAPGDMLLEYGIVAEGRLAGKVTRMVPVDLRGPLMRAMEQLGG